MTIDLFPRVLVASERRVLDCLLSVEFAGVEALRVQSTVVLGSGHAGAVVRRSILWWVQSAPLADVTERVPVSAVSTLPEPVGPVDILLFVVGD